MTNQNNEELRTYIHKWIEGEFQPVIGGHLIDADKLMKKIQSQTNKAISNVLDRLEVEVHPFDGNDDMADLIQQERNKLKEASNE